MAGINTGIYVRKGDLDELYIELQEGCILKK